MKNFVKIIFCVNFKFFCSNDIQLLESFTDRFSKKKRRNKVKTYEIRRDLTSKLQYYKK